MSPKVKAFFSSSRFWIIFGLLVTIAATAIEVARGRNTNYFDYYDSTMMFWSGLSPYTMEYAQNHYIYFLYTPVFSTLFMPIFALPWWLGPFVWNILNYGLFVLAVWTLPAAFAPHRLKIFGFVLSVVLQSVFCYQYNLVVCYLAILAFNLLERNRPFWAVLLIMLSTTTKIYGAAELLLLFCYPKVWRNFGYAALCGIGFLLLPALNPALDSIRDLYASQFEMIASHHSDSDFIGILFARGLKWLLLPNYRIVQFVVVALICGLFFLRHTRWNSLLFRTQMLAVLMGFIILFSDSPETHTYVIALTPYAMAFFLMPRRTVFDWVLFWLLFVNFCILPTDVLCPAWLHIYIHRTFWLDVYCMFIAWTIMFWRAAGPAFTDGENASGDFRLPKSALTLLALLALPAAVCAQEDRIFNVDGVTFTMKYVEGGNFLMGAAAGDTLADPDEFPQHYVTVGSFYLAETEVSQALWKAVMGKNRSKYKGDNWPAESISYDDAHEFIGKLNHLTGEHFRLPSEEEWEYAARGGNRSHGYLYSGSDDVDSVGWSLRDSMDYSHNDIRTRQPNELGLYDMSGSVWEWCETVFSEYENPKTNFLTQYFRSRMRIVRGGCLENEVRYLRVSNRYVQTTWRRERTVGMRLAM